MNDSLEHPYRGIGNGASFELADGLTWIRLPLPFPPRHVNVYRFEDEGGPVLVDCGFPDDATTACWKQLGSVPPAPDIVVTHFHPDHIGQAAHFEAMGARVHAPAPELEAAGELHALSGEQMQGSFAEFFALNGVSVPVAAIGGNRYRAAVPDLPAHAEPLGAGALPFAPSWSVSFAGGHSPAHALLYRHESPMLIAGDILLPEITPNISVWPNAPEADPLDDYLAALEELHKLPGNTLVLPAHGLPYRGVQRRIEAIRTHHEKRLSILRKAAGEGAALSAAEAIRLLFRPDLEPSSLPFALGEALAHLNRLRHGDELVRKLDEQGIYRYHARPRNS
ncbi:MAG: MBL fold metallo-hydrolase [Gammaproteobacteria bacterium]|nr:MBL fold metallo-hydrolase [Gammaproteobacteria bacterium]